MRDALWATDEFESDEDNTESEWEPEYVGAGLGLEVRLRFLLQHQISKTATRVWAGTQASELAIKLWVAFGSACSSRMVDSCPCGCRVSRPLQHT